MTFNFNPGVTKPTDVTGTVAAAPPEVTGAVAYTPLFTASPCSTPPSSSTGGSFNVIS